MPFTSVKRPNSCLPALSALRRCQSRFGTRNFGRVHQNKQTRCSMLSCPVGMPKTLLPRFRADTTAEFRRAHTAD